MSTNTESVVNQMNQVEDNEVQAAAKKGTRSFKVKLENNGPQYGRYNGDSPYQAANKALSEIIRNRVKNNQAVDDDMTFFLVESTKGSSKKIHKYVGRRIKLDVPVSYTVENGQVITKEYKNVLRKVKKSDVNGQQQQQQQQGGAQNNPEPLDV